MGKNSYKAQLNYYDSKWGWKSEGTASQGQWDGTGVRTGVLYFPGLAALKGKIETIEQLLSKCPMLADFKAVQNGNVWCTTQSLFQESMELPDLILDMNRVFTAESPNAVNEDELKFLTHVS